MLQFSFALFLFISSVTLGGVVFSSQYQEIEGIVGNLDSNDVEVLRPGKPSVKAKRWEINVKNIKPGCPVVAVVDEAKVKKSEPQK